jgi:kynurenine formamidase
MADDFVITPLQLATQYDALGHAWYGDQIYNGFPADSTVGSMSHANILPIAEKGVVGRGVLVDIARFRGKDWLEKGEVFDHLDITKAAQAQGVELRKRDILLIRTGWIEYFYSTSAEEFSQEFCEPGLTLSRPLVEWFQEFQIPNLVTDTIANEVTVDPVSGAMLPLHGALMRNLGVLFTEIAALERLAADCAEDGQYEFLYVASPLKIGGGTGSPVNPIVIK